MALLKAFVLLALGLGAAATQSFSNPGTKAGWDSFSIEHEGTVSEVTNVVYKGTTALKVTQQYDASYTGRYHAEAVHDRGYARGDQAFYGFAFRLSDSWEFDGQSFNLAQFIADFTDTGCDDWMPSSMVWIVGDQLYSRVKHGSICDQHITTYPDLATVSNGTWHRVEVQADWQSDNTGYYKIWFDGVKVLEKYNIATTIDDGREFSFRVGLYANGWHDDKKMVGSQPFRQVWYDEVAIGSVYGDADPTQWKRWEA